MNGANASGFSSGGNGAHGAIVIKLGAVYESILPGAYLTGANWDSYQNPPNDLTCGDYVIINHDITMTMNKKILGSMTINPGASLVSVVFRKIEVGKGGSNLGILDNYGLLNVDEIKRPGLVAELVGQNIAQQLEKKVNYRRAIKKSIQTTMSMGAQGIRLCVSGRLNGAEIARSETFRDGRVPLHTLRANIDYSLVEANTTYGIIGVKVWIFKGEIRGKR